MNEELWQERELDAFVAWNMSRNKVLVSLKAPPNLHQMPGSQLINTDSKAWSREPWPVTRFTIRMTG